MKRRFAAAACAAMFVVSVMSGAGASPPALNITIPLRLGAHRSHESAGNPSVAEIRAEKRLRLTRYALQLADAIVSAVGYHAYARCLSCLAYPGAGPRGGAPVTTATFNADRPAEVNPLIQPFSHGGFASLALGALAYDFVDARIEKHWSIQRRTASDAAEIGAHVWGISTWVPELRHIARNEATASACGAQWRAGQYGQAFTDGCVNAYFRAGTAPVTGIPGAGFLQVCAPARFKRGTYLFATANEYIIADGSPCSNVRSPFP